MFCEQYTSSSTAKLEAAVEELDHTIKDIELGLHLEINLTSGHWLQQKRIFFLGESEGNPGQFRLPPSGANGL